jgi:hypothetical protein
MRLNGDVDFNGQVQFPDFVVFASNFGQNGRTWSQGDFDSNGGVQFPDFVLFAGNFGKAAPQDGVLGDFNNDGLVGVADLDLLSAEVAGGGANAAFDLTNDNNVNQADVNALLGITNRLNGDVDFNGQVQFPDFVVFASNFGQGGRTWSQGDFDSSGAVQFPDFVLFAGNFGKSAPAATAVVPESTGGGAYVLVILGTTVLRQIRRRRGRP